MEKKKNQSIKVSKMVSCLQNECLKLMHVLQVTNKQLNNKKKTKKWTKEKQGDHKMHQ